MSTADLSIIVNGVEVLAVTGLVGALFFARRWLFAASPKADPKPAAPPASGTAALDGHSSQEARR